MKATTIRRAAVAGLASVALLGTTACSAFNLQATTLEYAPSDGVQTEVGNLEVRNLALISHGEDAAGRFIGTLATSDEQSANASITVNGESFDFEVPGGRDGALVLEEDENQTIVSSTGGAPGLMVDSEVSVNGETVDLQVPVLSAALPEYREFLPQDVSDEELTGHLYQETEGWGGHWSPDGGH